MEPVHSHEPLGDAPHEAPSPDALREIRARAEAAVRGQQDAAQQFEQRLEGCLDQLTQTLADNAAQEEAGALASVDEARQQLETERQAWQAEADAARQEIEAERAQIAAEREELAAARQQLTEHQQQLETARAEQQSGNEITAQQQASLAQQQQQLQAEREQLEHEQHALHAKQHELATQLDELEEERGKLLIGQQSLDEQTALLKKSQESMASGEAAEQQLAELTAERDAAREECESLKNDLTRAHQALVLAQEKLESDGVDALKQRFELAVADAQEYRHRIDQLEQELAERPAADAGASAEATRLREKCAELEEEISRLQSQSAPTAESSEEMADLQRRFEMAVEDVRELKREKELLEEQLAAKQGPPAAAIDGDDWEAQKRRLLASLEGEGAPTTPERTEERATIEGTIEITDEVIASKEAQIAELRQRLADVESDAPIVVESSLDDDERLEAERARLRQLQSQLEDKLREAELELSVERAKIARAKTTLEQREIDLKAREAAVSSQGGAGSGDGRRESNWLRKLGLGEKP